MQTLKTRLPDSELQPIKIKPGSRAYKESQAFFQLLTFNDLHRILDFPIINQLKNIKKYETEGNVWFYALPIGNLIPITENREHFKKMRMPGFEPGLLPWQGNVLPG